MVYSTVENLPKSISFAEYLVYEVEHGVRYELDRGQLVEMQIPSGLETKIRIFLGTELNRYFVDRDMTWIAIDLTGVRTEEDTSRIPDVVVGTRRNWDKVCDRKCAAVLDFEEKPSLVVEVTGENGSTDYIRKRAEYDMIDIPEYWIVDPDQSRIRMCSKFAGEENYSVRDFFPGDEVQSVQFPGLILPVNQVLSPPDVNYFVREVEALRRQQQQMTAEGQRAEAEGQHADAKQELRQQLEQQINAANQRAEAEHQRAEAACQRAEQLAQRLQALGIDPDTIN